MKALAGLVLGGVHLPVLDEDGTEALERERLWARGGRRQRGEEGEALDDRWIERSGGRGDWVEDDRGGRWLWVVGWIRSGRIPREK